MTPPRRALGATGEDTVAAWYAARGFEVLARNWSVREGELDVVARRAGLVVFCEVKTRSSAAYGSPALAVSVTKQRRLRRAAGAFLASTPSLRADELRFDVATVIGDDVEVIEGAF